MSDPNQPTEPTTPTQPQPTQPQPTQPNQPEQQAPDSRSWAERQGSGEGPDYKGLAHRVPMDPNAKAT